MKKPVQLLLPLDLTGKKISLMAEGDDEIVAAMGSLLLQILSAEEDEEVHDEQ
jgi:hypothetical protein